MIFQAGPLDLAGQVLVAVAERENVLEHLEGVLDRPGGGKRPEVAGAVLLEAAGGVDARPVLVDGDLDIRKALIVLEADVVVGPVLLDKVEFQDEGFLFRRGDEVIDIRDAGDHALRLGGEFTGGLEV